VAIPFLQKYLECFALRLTVSGPVLFLNKNNGSPCTIVDLTTHVTELGFLFESGRVTFPYKELADRTIKGCARVIESYCPYLDAAAIEKIHIEANAVCGLKEMIPYETKWCAWPDYGFVSMPDITQFPSDHIDFMMQKSHNPNKKMSKGWFLVFFGIICLRTPCHEVIHIIQGIAKQRGNTFQAEHDASYSMMSLMWAVSQLPTTKDMFVPGTCELLLSSQIQLATKIWKNLTENQKKEYSNWRENFGLVECPGWRSEGPEGLQLESQMKLLIAAEGISPRGEVKLPDHDLLKRMLDLIFMNRTGTTLSVLVPPDLKIEHNRIDILMSPVKQEEWKQVVNKIV